MLVAYVGLASAQAPDRREGAGGGAQEGAPQQRTPDASPAAPSEQQKSRAQQPSRQPDQVQRGADREQKGAAEQRARQGKGEADRDRAARDRDRAAQKEQSDQRRDADSVPDAAKRRADERTPSGSTKRTEQRNLERQKAAERAKQEERAREAERGKQGDDRQGREPARTDTRREDQPKAGAQTGASVTARGDELRRAREQLAPEQRQRLRTSFDFRGARATNSRVQPRVAFRVPKSVRLFPVPTAVVSLFPDYRNYRYVVVQDQVCIVDPATYEVVDVIDQGYYAYAPSNSTAPGLSLTNEQIALVRDSIPKDFPDTEAEVPLNVGAVIPARAELHEFPQPVLDRIPKLRDYRFLVIGAHLVIADTDGRKVELVLDRI
jgi:hypothetical protein